MMFNWIMDNVRGKHMEKKQELKNLDEYWEFMIEDFNKRLRLATGFGMVIGFIAGIGFGFGIFGN